MLLVCYNVTVLQCYSARVLQFSGFTIHMDISRTDDTRLGNIPAEMNTNLDATCLRLSNDNANKTTSCYVCEKLLKTMLNEP
jgi:hypothetical protein